MDQGRRGGANGPIGGRGRVKRREVDDGNGWTVITHGMSRMEVSDMRTDSNSKNKSRTVLNHTNGPSSQVVQNLTMSKLQEQVEMMHAQYKGSSVAKQVSEVMGKNSHQIKEAVCIGIGSFSRDWEHRYRSLWQLVLFIDAVQQLSANEVQVRLYAQDPAFTTLDMAFLEVLKVNITKDDIQKHISSSTLVFSPFVDWFILLPVFIQSKKPALYIGNEILDNYSTFARSDEKKEKLEECNKLGSLFLEDYNCVKVKDFEYHAHALNGMIIYTRKSEDNAGQVPS